MENKRYGENFAIQMGTLENMSLEKLVLDAKRISNRLNDKLVLGDSLTNEIEVVNEQLKTLRTVRFHSKN